MADEPMAEELRCLPVTGLGEVIHGDDLAALLVAAVTLEDGDVLVLTSKVASKAEGRVVSGDRADLLASQTQRVVARRGATTIVRTPQGLVMAAGGIDASNTAPGTVVLLPEDPDRTARELRARIRAATGCNVAVIVSDTSGRAWRNGQTDIAVGAAGITVLVDHAGRVDGYGNPLRVTAPAVADELAGAADLVKGKLTGWPAAVIRGVAPLVLPPGEDGPGAAALVRAQASDMFGYGAREAVLAAVLAEPGDLTGFGAPAGRDELAEALGPLLGGGSVQPHGQELDVLLPARSGPAGQRDRGAREARVTTVAHALGWQPASREDRADVLRVRLRRCGPTP